jgi:isocitrate lyase
VRAHGRQLVTFTQHINCLLIAARLQADLPGNRDHLWVRTDASHFARQQH